MTEQRSQLPCGVAEEGGLLLAGGEAVASTVLSVCGLPSPSRHH